MFFDEKKIGKGQIGDKTLELQIVFVKEHDKKLKA
jgi:hypothetical protein